MGSDGPSGVRRGRDVVREKLERRVQGPLGRWVRGRDLVVPLAVWAVSGLLVGALLVAGAASSKRGVRERQELRSQLGAVFLATQARDVVAREQGLAQQYLSVE